MADAPPKKRVRPVVPYPGKIDASGAPGTDGSRRTNPMVFLLVAGVLAVMGWFLIQNLWSASKQQDCMMSGRRNCLPSLDTTAR